MKKRSFERLSGRRLEFTELGFGTAMTGNLFQAVDDDTAHAALEAAWDTGVRYFDTAPLYGLGLAETRLNRFLRSKPRDEYVLSTKVGRLLEPCRPEERTAIGKFFDVPNRREVYDFTHDGVLRSIEFSLERLGVDRIDLLFAHDLDVFNHGSWDALQVLLDQFMAGGYKALLRLRDEGVIAGFGAGINEWQPAQWMLERGDVDIFLRAGRYFNFERETLTTTTASWVNDNTKIGYPHNHLLVAIAQAMGVPTDTIGDASVRPKKTSAPAIDLRGPLPGLLR